MAWKQWSQRIATYLVESSAPFTSLVFLLPLIVIYEVGTLWFARDAFRGTEQRIVAFTLLQDFYQLFQASGRLLPALTVVAILLAWHVARKDSWRPRLSSAGWMYAESVLQAIPLLLLGALVSAILTSPVGLWAPPPDRRALVVLSIGAGIYEELVFRLILMTALSLLLLDALKLKPRLGMGLIVATSALTFAGYHYLGSEPFDVVRFIFRTLAGAYFAVLFLTRGFGITAGAHIAYDIIVVHMASSTG